jgi:hypothetical protein
MAEIAEALVGLLGEAPLLPRLQPRRDPLGADFSGLSTPQFEKSVDAGVQGTVGRETQSDRQQWCT